MCVCVCVVCVCVCVCVCIMCVQDARQLSEVQITEKLDKKMTEIMAGGKVLI